MCFVLFFSSPPAVEERKTREKKVGIWNKTFHYPYPFFFRVFSSLIRVILKAFSWFVFFFFFRCRGWSCFLKPSAVFFLAEDSFDPETVWQLRGKKEKKESMSACKEDLQGKNDSRKKKKKVKLKVKMYKKKTSRSFWKLSWFENIQSRKI